MIKILYEEFYTKTIEIEKIVQTMGHYSLLAERISQLQGRSLVKKSTLRLLNQVPVQSGQPLQMVIHKQRADLTILMLRCRSANADKDWEFHQVGGLWQAIFQSTDDLFSPLKTKKTRLSEIQSSIVLRVYKLLKEGFSPLLKEKEILLEEDSKSYEQLRSEYLIRRAWFGK